MESIPKQDKHVEDEEEYLLLDLDAVSAQVEIPPNAPYVLSGLDTLNPVLVIGDKLKLLHILHALMVQCRTSYGANVQIGEYEETIGTCIVFSESDIAPVLHEETGPSEENLFMGKCIENPNQGPAKQVKPVASLHKILKFRLSPDVDIQAPKLTDSNL
ncbi:PREDICTED: uncharacterized protein LOC104586434 isoform X1 [Nelumbo nucifera]|uniref:Uncharacterized protein LOC104586434 isoform X1 n=2 Tax=Nelumbo nucifera TaxID=4432 RepID=A0A1U7YSF8_NELNU|nr:PREDICTED: uncharacterized protein LOC104586434 isoform X1 [Nelumbo nucifera]DAD20898.1 TPA_asm: hypothetical protein HUJ06_022361 [Nelumbo nucifera]